MKNHAGLNFSGDCRTNIEKCETLCTFLCGDDTVEAPWGVITAINGEPLGDHLTMYCEICILELIQAQW